MYLRLLVPLLCCGAAFGEGVSGVEPACSVTVTTTSGPVRGVRRVTDGGRAYYSFRNVTYATQPLGDLRFRELLPAETWSEVRSAAEDGPACPQRDPLYERLAGDGLQSEACIHASVHVPAWAPPPRALLEGCPRTPTRGRSARLLPVVVFVHGGGFSFGAGGGALHGPDALVERGLVVITFNYRLNVLGFLSLNTSAVPGNAGLRDVLTLLRWVRREAANFGGDSRDVTLIGQSAGAATAHILSLVPEGRGLFRRIIMMSGAAGRSFFSTSPIAAKSAAGLVLDRLNLSATDPETTRRCLVSTPVEVLRKVAVELQDLAGVTDFVPVVEADHPAVRPVVSRDLDEAILEGVGADTPRIIGFAENECLSFSRRFAEIDIAARLESNPVLAVPPALIYSSPPDRLAELARRVSARYFPDGPSLERFVRYCSDAYFVYPALHAAESAAAAGGEVYVYKFGYHGGGSELLQEATGYRCGDPPRSCGVTAHIEDLLYVFRPESISGNYTREDEEMRHWMSTLFGNFARTGNPSSSQDRYSQWYPSTPGRLRYLDIRSPRKVKTVELDDELLDMKRFFDDLYKM